MKKLIYTITALIAFTISVNAQVGIETDTVSDKAILDFPDEANGGIRLPYVETLDLDSSAGTLFYDASTGRISLKNSTTTYPITPGLKDPDRVAKHDISSFPDQPDSKGVEISDNTANNDAIGVLVLNSTSRALALPKVSSVDKIQSPTPGMICFDVSRQALAIYNGEHWTLRN